MSGRAGRRRLRAPPSRSTATPAPLPQAGFALVEVLIAATLLAVAFLALGASGAFSIKNVSGSRGQLHSWTAVGQVADSLIGAGWGEVSDDSATVDDVRLSWTVTAAGAELDRVDLAVERPSAGLTGLAHDTIQLYLARP